MTAYRRNITVGVVVLAALGILAWMILKFANQAADFFLSEGMRISLVADRADGLGDGSAIMYRGVQVGRVKAIRRVAGNEQILIEALIDTKGQPPLPADVEGVIRSTSALGGSAEISLEDLPAGAPRVNRDLAEGDTIAARARPDIMSLSGEMTGLTGQLSRILERVDREVLDEEALRDFHETLDNARATSESARRIAEDMEKVSTTFDATSRQAMATMQEVQAAVRQGRGHMAQINGDVARRMDQVAASLDHVQSVMAKIDEGEGTAGMLVNDPRLYEGLADTVAELGEMVADLRRLIQQWEEEGASIRLGGG